MLSGGEEVMVLVSMTCKVTEVLTKGVPATYRLSPVQCPDRSRCDRSGSDQAWGRAEIYQHHAGYAAETLGAAIEDEGAGLSIVKHAKHWLVHAGYMDSRCRFGCRVQHEEAISVRRRQGLWIVN